MKQFLLAILFSVSFRSGYADQNLDTPELHKIKQFTLEAPFSCGGDSKKSSFFLSNLSMKRGFPDLLYNGACHSGDNYVEVRKGTDDMSLITDLGDISIQEVSANMIFNPSGVAHRNSQFAKEQIVKEGHTYGVLINTKEIRALYVFRVISHTKDGPMKIDVAVKFYSINNTIVESKGFDWTKDNSYKYDSHVY